MRNKILYITALLAVSIGFTCIGMDHHKQLSAWRPTGFLFSETYTGLYGNEELPVHIKSMAEECKKKYQSKGKKVIFKSMNSRTSANNKNPAFSINTLDGLIIWLNCSILPGNSIVQKFFVDHEYGHFIKYHALKRYLEDKSWGILGCTSLVSLLFSNVPKLSLKMQSTSLQAASLFGILAILKRGLDSSTWYPKMRSTWHKKQELAAHNYAIQESDDPEVVLEYLNEQKN